MTDHPGRRREIARRFGRRIGTIARVNPVRVVVGPRRDGSDRALANEAVLRAAGNARASATAEATLDETRAAMHMRYD
jgi:hypothetical protein